MEEEEVGDSKRETNSLEARRENRGGGEILKQKKRLC